MLATHIVKVRCNVKELTQVQKKRIGCFNPTIFQQIKNVNALNVETKQFKYFKEGDVVEVKNTFKPFLFCKGSRGVIRKIVQNGNIRFWIELFNVDLCAKGMIPSVCTWSLSQTACLESRLGLSFPMHVWKLTLCKKSQCPSVNRTSKLARTQNGSRAYHPMSKK